MGDDLDFRLGTAAAQLGLINPGQFAEAWAEWGARGQTPLGEILVERGWIDDDECRCLTALLRRDRSARAASPPREPAQPPLERYAWKKPHAKGGLGEIWLGRDELLHRDVALKRVHRDRRNEAEARGRFLKEAEITGQLQHPNIVPVYDLKTLGRDGPPFYVMKMVGGRNLGQVIAEGRGSRADGRVDAARRRRLLELFLRVCDALEYAHSRRVVHRDLKPDNIMVGEFGEVVVLDWGLAKLLDGPEPEEADGRVSISEEARGALSLEVLRGAPAYMSPEQAEKRTDLVDERTDVYGLGTILFEILTGEPPHRGHNVPEILARVRFDPTPRARSFAASVPVGLEEACAKAMARSREDRYASVAELAGAVKRWLADEPVTVYRAAVDRYRKLAEEHTERPRYLAELARNQTILGLVLSGLDRNAEAEAEIRAAIVGLERVIAARPTVLGHRSELAANRVHLHSVLMALGRHDEAAQSRSRAEDEYSSLIRIDPTDPHHRIAFASALENFGLGPVDVQHRMAGLPAETEGSSWAIDLRGGGELDWGKLYEALVERLQLLDSERFLEACESLPPRGKSLVNWLIEQRWIDPQRLSEINQLLGQRPRAGASEFEAGPRSASAWNPPGDPEASDPSGLLLPPPNPEGSQQDAPTMFPETLPYPDHPQDFGDTGSRFQILEPLARGSLGNISIALDTELNRRVALKEIRDEYADHPQVRARFHREAEIAASLEHPGIVTIYGLGRHPDGRPYYAMRLIRGESLKSALKGIYPDSSHDGPGRVAEVLRGLVRRFRAACDAIDFAHARGVVHRDLKPGNVMVGLDGQTVVVDWGLAKVLGRDDPEGPAEDHRAGGTHETYIGSIIGTPAYMSPEQAEGRLEELGPNVDIYGLGATLYEILCGVSPYPSQDVEEVLAGARLGNFAHPRRVRPDVPPELEAICLKAMAFRPSDRYSTPQALSEDVDRWLASESGVG